MNLFIVWSYREYPKTGKSNKIRSFSNKYLAFKDHLWSFEPITSSFYDLAFRFYLFCLDMKHHSALRIILAALKISLALFSKLSFESFLVIFISKAQNMITLCLSLLYNLTRIIQRYESTELCDSRGTNPTGLTPIGLIFETWFKRSVKLVDFL